MSVGSTATGPSIYARTQVISSMNGLGACTNVLSIDAHVMHGLYILGNQLPNSVSYISTPHTRQGFAHVHVSVFLAFQKDIKASHSFIFPTLSDYNNNNNNNEATNLWYPCLLLHLCCISNAFLGCSSRYHRAQQPWRCFCTRWHL